ncbi:ribonuclease Z [Gracilibacillus sp. YIM 98692]|uniref:ribonuclease Z n=1 Tax=Gracilibacillus sp. YIM 98692 TaxID=2663532 RepID=UPI0013D3645E|nr:ribonuclease Z [Gracilibacillus sp. YIM 98692]
MKVLFLGTGAGLPSKQRNVTSILLDILQEDQSIWMFDCGEATQHQILHTSIRPRKINKIFITHLHGDHIYGLPGFLSSRSFQGGTDPVTVYGPKGIQEFIETSLAISETKLTYPLHFHHITEGLLCENEHFYVYSKKLDHGIPSYGFRIVEKNMPGPLLVDKLKQDGIMPGPVYQQLKEKEQVQLEDGSIIQSSTYIGKEKKGRIISIMGDTRYREEHISFVQNSDVLIHEATFSKDQTDLAYQYFHSTTKQAAQLAKIGNVKKLMLTHISARFQQQDLDHLLHESQEYFPNTFLVYDFFEQEI